MLAKKKINTMADMLGAPAILRWFFRRELTILTYHGFRQDQEGVEFAPFIGNHLSVSHLQQQLRYITKHYHPLSLPEAFDRMRSGKLPNNALVFAIDDGYESIYKLAYPLLQKYNVPATVFLSTAFLDRKTPLWFDRLLFAVVRTKNPSLLLSLGGKAKVFELDCLLSRKHCQQFVNSYAKNCSQDKRDEMIAYAEDQLGVKLDFSSDMPAIFRPLSWDQVRQMHASRLITFGPHGDGHYILSKCPPAMQREDIIHSYGRVADELKTRPRFFAYPNGESADFTSALYTIFSSLGVDAACTTMHGFNTSATDQYALKRISILDWMDRPDFALQLVLFVKVMAKLSQLPRSAGDKVKRVLRINRS